jgi:hypothetical protein
MAKKLNNLLVVLAAKDKDKDDKKVEDKKSKLFQKQKADKE